MSTRSSVRMSVKVKARHTDDILSSESSEKHEDDRILTDSALTFLESISESDFGYLLFTDQLITTSDTGRQLGEFIVKVEEGTYEGQDCFVIHANSHGSIDNVPCGTSIIAHIGLNLQTYHQQHHEYVKLVNCPLDRKTNTVLLEDGLLVTRIITQGDDVNKISKSFTNDEIVGFISEGSNLLLHRLLVTKGIPDSCVFISFDSDINLCAAKYKKLEERLQTINEVQVRVHGIERTILSLTDLPTSWQSYFTADGHLAHRVQIGSPVVMRLSKFPEPILRDDEPPKPKFAMANLDWYQDMQLFSVFMDTKEELKGEHGTYIRDHPDLRPILADFLQYLLLHKPNDVVAFSAEYFTSFAARMPQTSTFATSLNLMPANIANVNTRLNERRQDYINNKS